MKLEDNIKEIRRLYKVLFNKECEVFLAFTGTELGNTNSWYVRCDNREAKNANHELAVLDLLDKLQQELKTKITSTRNELKHLENSLVLNN